MTDASHAPDTQMEPQPTEMYTFQPEPPHYYPQPHVQEQGGISKVPHTGFKRRRIAASHGNGYDNTRRNLYRWARWCADGSSVLAQAEDRSLHVYETPEDIPDATDGTQETSSTQRDFNSADNAIEWNVSLVSRQPTPIVSAAWYPSASRYNPATYCYVVGTRDRPVRLIDANDGRTRATYSILQTEQFLGPTCMAFNNDATKLYCGHDTAIDVFDFSQPGAEGSRIKLSPSRKSKDGQKGIVSAIAFSPDASSGMFAVGTFKGGRISCYSEDTGDERLLELELGTRGASVDGQGITQLAFHPLNPYVLFSASRQSDYISVYDIRNASYGPYLHLYRPGMTQQRLGFDIDWAGRTLTTGGTDGTLRVYDINPPISETPVVEHVMHNDAMGSVALHPFQPWILTAHGSRKPSLFEKSLENQSDSESETDSSEEDESSSSDEDSGEESEASTAGELEHDVPRELVAKQSGRTNGDALAEHKGPGATPLRDPPALPKGGWIGAIEIGQLY